MTTQFPFKKADILAEEELIHAALRHVQVHLEEVAEFLKTAPVPPGK